MRKIIILIVAAASMTACTSIRPYRCDFPESPVYDTGFSSRDQRYRNLALKNCDEAIESGPADRPFKIGFVEFDDIGNYWYREQFNYVFKELSDQLEQGPVVTVVFVHGWNHNAQGGDDEDGNVTEFKNVLGKIAAGEAQLARMQGPEAKPRRVFGIYISWRGAAFDQGGASNVYNWLSYWKRKSVAHRVGRSGGVTEALAKVEAAIDHGPENSRLVLVGHSFGGALLFDSVAQSILIRTAREEPDFSFGDLVVLANPAFEAARLDIIRDALRKQQSSTFPVLAIFTARNDSATRYMLAAGEQVGSWWVRHRPSRSGIWSSVDPAGRGQGARARKAVGHYEPFFTHCLRPREGSVAATRTSRSEGEAISCNSAEAIELGSWLLVPRQDVEPSPLWVVPVNHNKVIEGHNTIFTDNFMDILTHIVRKSDPLYQELE